MSSRLQPVIVLALMLAGMMRPAAGQTPAAEDSSAKGAISSAAKPAKETSDPGLAVEQARVADKYKELERLILRMAEVIQPTDPKRAALLRQTFSQSKERQINLQFEDLVSLLEKEQLYQASKGQVAVEQDLKHLLQLLLSGERDKQIPNERAQLKRFIERINKLIREQQGVQGETEGHGNPADLANRQDQVADKTGELARDVDRFDSDRKAKTPDEKPGEKSGEKSGKKSDAERGEKSSDKSGEKSGEKSDAQPGEKSSEPSGDKSGKSDQKPSEKSGEPSEGKSGKPSQSPSKPQKGSPGQPGEPGEGEQSQQPNGQTENEQPSARKRIQQAEERMREAKKRLDEAERRGAAQEQQKAIEELKQAKAQLEEILRQLREEEIERVLVMLESRIRKMLQMQIEVYEGTVRLDRIPEDQRDRDVEIESGKLSRNEALITAEADKALSLLREEGSSVAFPETVEQMREDMEQVTARLARANVGEITQGIEQDIIKSLEEMIAALQKAQKDQQKRRGGRSAGSAGESDQDLVDQIAELKMIRALQMRVNTRTQRYSRMLAEGVEQAEQPELVEALKRLGQREERIYRTTRDIVVGRNR